MKKLFTLLAGLSLSIAFSQLTEDRVQNYSNVSTMPEQALAACDQGILYGEPISYIGDLSTVFIANQFTIEANTEFNYTSLLMNLTVPSGGEITNSEIQIFTDVDGLPGEMIHSAVVVPSNSEFFQEISFTGGETAEEFIVTFDLSSFPAINTAGETKYWIATKPLVNPAPLRQTVQEVTDVATMLLRTSGWGPLASSANPDVPLNVPFTLIGDCNTMGVEDSYTSSFSVYPNPVKDVLNVSLKNAEVKSISVTNLSGQIVATSKNATVNVSALPAGVYVVKVLDTKGATHTSKVVVK